jgi:hypothetical protein
VDYLLEFATLSQPSTDQLLRLVPSLTEHIPEIMAYVLTSGSLVVRGPFRRLAQHTWVYGLLIEEQDGASRVREWLGDRLLWLRSASWIGRHFQTPASREVTLAYVLTRTSFEDRVLLYRGFLKAFGIKSDGTFTYLVLVQPHRMYMQLSEGVATTTSHDAVHQISANHLSARDGIAPSFFIDGSQIANVFFDREHIPNRGTTANFERVVAEQLRVIATEESASGSPPEPQAQEVTITNGQ